MMQSVLDDIIEFHSQFGLYPPGGNKLPKDMQKFRTQALIEEVFEYAFATGYVPVGFFPAFLGERAVHMEPRPYTGHVNEADAFDALIDLVYFALGTAYMHGFPFKTGWDRVHAANMKKRRALSSSESKRGTTYDVVKPLGWQPPVLDDLLEEIPTIIDPLACNED